VSGSFTFLLGRKLLNLQYAWLHAPRLGHLSSESCVLFQKDFTQVVWKKDKSPRKPSRHQISISFLSDIRHR
jgi:hypothetical protein